jgi:deferrochelatase/peroxidase EfeB
MIRRGTSYGPSLPEGVVEDDGIDRGLMFAFIGANLSRQFEFVQSEWMNTGGFFVAFRLVVLNVHRRTPNKDINTESMAF